PCTTNWNRVPSPKFCESLNSVSAAGRFATCVFAWAEFNREAAKHRRLIALKCPCVALWFGPPQPRQRQVALCSFRYRRREDSKQSSQARKGTFPLQEEST